MADKIDSFVGLFGAGELPTGDKDPYALRRAALSILRILIEREHDLSLSELVSMSAEIYSDLQEFTIDDSTQLAIVKFIRGRLTAFYQSQDIATNTINAVMACEPDSPLDFEQRVKAVHAFFGSASAADLAAANKRVSNILKKQNFTQSINIESNLFEHDEEHALFNAIDNIDADCSTLFDSGDYKTGLNLSLIHI